MPPITPVVKQLLILNIVIYFLTQMLFPEYAPYLALYFPGTQFFSPYQIVSHMFMHANFNHILFNMFGLYMFGTMLEMRWGPKRFLTFYFLCGFGAMLLHLLSVYYEYQGMVDPRVRMLGASGAVFGLLAGYGMMFPNHRIMLLIPPIPMKAKYFVLGYAAIELFLGVSNSTSGIAHFAHIGGAIVGALLVFIWRRSGKI